MRRTLTAALILAGLAAPALAMNATGAEILAAISGNTVQGSMDATGAYTEYYAADGTVFGDGYKAVWSVEGDRTCWVYEGSPKDCWDASIAGDQITWIKDGAALGTGTILPGNPNGFQ